MILDSSAVVTLLLRHPGYEQIFEVLAGSDVLGMGAPTLTETRVVLAVTGQRWTSATASPTPARISRTNPYSSWATTSRDDFLHTDLGLVPLGIQ